MAKDKKITIQGTAISIIVQQQDDYISLTDMAPGANCRKL
jgi:hypothetical protein